MSTGTWEIDFTVPPEQVEDMTLLVERYATVAGSNLDVLPNGQHHVTLYVVAREQRSLEQAVMWASIEARSPVLLTKSEWESDVRPRRRRWWVGFR